MIWDFFLRLSKFYERGMCVSVRGTGGAGQNFDAAVELERPNVGFDCDWTGTRIQAAPQTVYLAPMADDPYSRRARASFLVLFLRVLAQFFFFCQTNPNGGKRPKRRFFAPNGEYPVLNALHGSWRTLCFGPDSAPNGKKFQPPRSLGMAIHPLSHMGFAHSIAGVIFPQD